MKTVLHVIVGLEVGGAEMVLSRLIKDAAAHSKTYQHAVVSLTSVGVLGRQLRAEGFDVHELRMTGPASMPLALARLWGLMRRVRPDIVQTWMYHADLLGGLAARLAGIKRLIWGIRATEVYASDRGLTNKLRWLCARLSHLLPAVIVCAADASRQRHVDLGYRADRMVVVNNGFDLDALHAPREAVQALRGNWGLVEGAPVLGCVGRFNPEKDPRNFVQAAALLAPRFPDLRFVMVGRDCDRHNAALMRWIDALQLRERFVLAGERRDIPVCLALMDVFCLPSRTEGFPNVVGEAMAMGKPCVVTDVGDASLLLDGHGIVVPRENPEALAEGAAQLLQLSEAQRDAIGARGRARIEAEFSIERCRQRLESIYSNLMDATRR